LVRPQQDAPFRGIPRSRLKALRAQIRTGVDAPERGDFAGVDNVDLERYLDRLTTTAGKKRAR
jgi:hypothetical protein